MKRIGGMLLGVGAVFLMAVAPAQAGSLPSMRVIVARILGGQVEVVGIRAAKKAPISWQGTEVATSTAGGTFFFRNAAVPASCVGKLSDGAETAYVPVQGCVPTGVNLAVTGQTTPNDQAGEDGAVQAGVPFPSPRFTVKNGTVTDNLTGLIWLQEADCIGSDTWSNALGDANSLQTGDCGLSDGSSAGDWRLPNLKELQSLVDYENGDPALPVGYPFTDFQWSSSSTSYYYWSSTSDAEASGKAWAVGFNDGDVDASSTGTDFYVLPVRGGR